MGVVGVECVVYVVENVHSFRECESCHFSLRVFIGFIFVARESSRLFIFGFLGKENVEKSKGMKRKENEERKRKIEEN